MTELAAPAGDTTAFKRPKFIHGLNVSDEVIINNVEANAKRKLPWVSVRKAVVCGGGPSLADNLSAIREFKARGFHVYALNNTAKFLKANGIQPNCQFLMDARPQNLEFILPVDPAITYFISSQCDPSLFDALEGHDKVHMVHIVNGNKEQLMKLFPGSSLLTQCPTSGIMVLNLLTVLGYMVVHCFGYDSSHRGDNHHAYPQALNDEQKLHDFKFMDKVYVTSGPMASQAEQFIQFYRRYSPHMQIEVHGEGLLPDMWRYHEYVRTHGSIELAERTKYEKMWTIPDYRRDSPGERHVEVALQVLGAQPPARIIDFGCGPGRATLAMKNKGFDVLGVDIAKNCLDPEIEGEVPFLLSCLWDLPKLEADYGYSCDVMEHIPPHKVEDVLAGMARSTTKGCFFAISFCDDKFGDRIGEQLHLTIRDRAWWYHRMTKHWAKVECVDECGFVCREAL